MRPALIAALLALTAAPAAAQLETHRTGAVADDGTGWHRAVSTKGGFSVRVPMPFNDVTVRVNDTNVGEVATHTIGGTNPKGIKITASEMPITPRMKNPTLEGILASFGSQVKPESVTRSKGEGKETLGFSLADARAGAYITYVKTAGALYTLIIEYPTAAEADAAAMKEPFFSSLTIGK